MVDINDNNIVSKEALWDSTVREGSGLYNQVVVVASSFLGGSLLFIEQIASNIEKCTLCLLFIGWFCLISSICLLLWIRRINLVSHRYGLEENWEKALEIAPMNELRTTCMTWLLVAGIFFITLFGAINLFINTS